MSCCAPACAVPTCIPACSPPVCYPVGALGSLTSYGVGSYRMSPYGMGSAGGSVSAASLAIAQGASVSGINQIPPFEIVIEPPPFVVVFEGAILSATFQPIRVGRSTA